MTIRRQYSLPNCTLVLEGLSDGSAASQLDLRPVLSILMSAECYVTGLGEPLSGGREFFESLVRAVSSYAQEFNERSALSRSLRPEFGYGAVAQN